MSDFLEQIELIQHVRTLKELLTIVQAHGGVADRGILRDPYAERAAMDAAIKLYQAQGLGYNHAAQAAEVLFYAKANPMWSELIAAEAKVRNAAIIEAARRKKQEPDTRAIDPVKLKAAAEHLEWVLLQYPESEDVQSLLRALMPLIEDAKVDRVQAPVDSMMDIPGAYNFSDGRYVPYRTPDVGEAYAIFMAEMEGGLSEEEEGLLADVDDIRNPIKLEAKS